jgi:hypothetical protein
MYMYISSSNILHTHAYEDGIVQIGLKTLHTNTQTHTHARARAHTHTHTHTQGVLYEDGIVQIGLKTHYQGNKGKLGLFIGNKLQEQLHAFELVLGCVCCVCVCVCVCERVRE